MSDTVKDITGIFALLVSVGMVTVLVKQGNQTSQVVTATFGGFAQALQAAMGGTVSSTLSGIAA
jgi:hypothetical protein